MLTDKRIVEIIQNHYPCFDAQDDAELLALEREIDAEACKAERERWYYAVKRWIESGSNQTLDELIDQLRKGA